MKFYNNTEILKDLDSQFKHILNNIEGLSENILDFKSLPSNTTLIIVDMINGFAKQGHLSSINIKNLIPNIVELSNKFYKNNKNIIAYRDSHPKNAKEFLYYPMHCIENTDESQLIEELNHIDNIICLNKNSTNGFLAYNPEKALKERFGKKKSFNNFILVGGCTDICVYQLAISLKTYFNEKNEGSCIIVPLDMIDTFNVEGHNANIMNLFFINSMIANGIKVVKTIK